MGLAKRGIMPRDKSMAHYDGCWHEHHECAIAKIEQLEAELKRIKDLLNSYNIAVFDNHVVRVTKK